LAADALEEMDSNFLFGAQNVDHQWAYNTIDEWQHVCTVYDPGLLTFYHNGQPVASRAVSVSSRHAENSREDSGILEFIPATLMSFGSMTVSLSDADIYWIYSNQARLTVTGLSNWSSAEV
jgi:hypothetical protein